MRRERVLSILNFSLMMNFISFTNINDVVILMNLLSFHFLFFYIHPLSLLLIDNLEGRIVERFLEGLNRFEYS
jgi:hypothetical protein